MFKVIKILEGMTFLLYSFLGHYEGVARWVNTIRASKLLNFAHAHIIYVMSRFSSAKKAKIDVEPLLVRQLIECDRTARLSLL